MDKRIVFPSSSCNIIINSCDIVYCKAQGNYSIIVCINQKESLVTKYLKDLEFLLKDNGFIRIHRKYLVNRNFISEYALNGKPYLKLNGNIKLPVSRQKTQALSILIKEMMG